MNDSLDSQHARKEGMAMNARLFIAFAGLGILMGGPTVAATWHVPAQVATIDAALDGAAHGDSVIVAPGTYYESHLNLPSGVVMIGSVSDPSTVIIDAQQQDYVMIIPQADDTSVLEGFTLTGGSSPGSGGGLHCGYPTRATVRHCDIVGNSAATGGGLACYGADPVFEHCRFLNNTGLADGVLGGGAVILNSSHPVFRDCVFAGNTTQGNGGAVAAYAATASFENCTFTGNTAPNGSAIFVYHAEATFADCALTDNIAVGYGVGAAYVYEGELTFENCTISGNQADTGAGVFGSSNSSISMSHCAVVANAGTFGAGGIELWFGSTFIADSCEFADNTTGGVPGDGAVDDGCSATLVCCETSPELWSGDGTVVFDNDGCTVGIEQVTWGDVKALFR
ncbi:MAG: right-handed parallel beta-helix repeat-containing protein [bacterium]|nr:right-handed parallel beta-helix repeat-containing protein [bacterium]MBP6768497.1 right-handed parallel beta-helix repeat-containing protein [Reyranella sp.]